MIETLLLALLAGGLLGVFFFGGLWLTVRKGMQAAVPAAWFLLSFLLRMAVALAGFYGIAKFGEWQHLALALLGFVVARMVLTRFIPEPLSSSPNSEVVTGLVAEPLAESLTDIHKAADSSSKEQRHAS